MFEILERLAVFLDKAEAVAKAKEAQHAHAHETDEALTQQRRAEQCHDFSAAVRKAIASLKSKAKRGAFTPPTWEEVKAYAFTLGWPEPDVRKWFLHFESNGWKVGGKATMKSWKAAAQNGHTRWRETHPSSASRKPSEGDPKGWKDFIREMRLDYAPFANAMEYIRDDFALWLKRK